MEATDSVPPPLRRAATVMLVRDGREGLEVYLTRRSAASAFVPGAYVFPGGAVDAADGDARAVALLRGRLDVAPELAVAACRELFEEAGVLLACDARGVPVVPSAAWVARSRERLRAGQALRFADVLAEAALCLDASALYPYSNWVTPPGEARRFDTHFFLAALPAGQTALADAREVYDGTWSTPGRALERYAAGELTVIFPTRMHLERLQRYRDIESLLAHARTRRYEPLHAVALGDGGFAPAGGAEW